jgi:peptidoglycan-associated lipoprotein
MRKYLAVIPVVVFLLISASACKPQVTLTASRERVKQGEEVELTWTSKKAKGVTINNQDVAKEGTMKATPRETTTYEAIAKRGSKEARAMARVEVIPPPPRPIVSIRVSPDVIERGRSSSVQWSSSNAESVEVSGLGRVEGSGSREVSPQASTTYTAIARGPGGEATASARLTVNEPPPPPPPPRRDPPPPPPRNVEAEFAENVLTIYFEFDSADLDDTAQTRLRQAADWLTRSENRTVIFMIEGNCDERGTEEYNLALGDRRANAARDFLVGLGVSVERVRTVSYGESRPVESGHDESAWSKNRRDDFKYVEGGERVVPRR